MPTLNNASGELAVINTTGFRVYIGTVGETWANRDSDTYQELGNVENAGTIGYGWTFGSYTLQATGNPVQYKQTRNYGTYTPTVAFNPTDTGLSTYLAESDKTADNPINFAVVADDNPDPTGDGTPTTIYLRGIPGGLDNLQLGPAGEIVRGSLQIGLREFPEFNAADEGTP